MPPSYTYSGQWNGVTVGMTLVQGARVPSGVDTTKAAGQLTGFSSDDPAVTCLSLEKSLSVYAVPGTPNEYLVLAQNPGDCANADFTFIAPN